MTRPTHRTRSRLHGADACELGPVLTQVPLAEAAWRLGTVDDPVELAAQLGRTDLSAQVDLAAFVGDRHGDLDADLAAALDDGFEIVAGG